MALVKLCGRHTSFVFLTETGSRGSSTVSFVTRMVVRPCFSLCNIAETIHFQYRYIHSSPLLVLIRILPLLCPSLPQPVFSSIYLVRAVPVALLDYMHCNPSVLDVLSTSFDSFALHSFSRAPPPVYVYRMIYLSYSVLFVNPTAHKFTSCV